MFKYHKYRIYPTKQQEYIITNHFNACRFVFNHFVDKQTECYNNSRKIIDYNDCIKELPKLMKDNQWLYSVDSPILENSIKEFAQYRAATYKKKKFVLKHRAARGYRQSYKVKNNANIMKVVERRIHIPGVGALKTRDDFNIDGKIYFATISLETTGKYYAAICFDYTTQTRFKKTGKVVGIDLGVDSYCTLSSGYQIPLQNFHDKSLDKIRKLNKQLSRQEKGSNNYNKTLVKLRKVYDHIHNQRQNYIQRMSTWIVKNYDIICVDRTKLNKMLANCHFHNVTCDASWSSFLAELKHKCEIHNKQYVENIKDHAVMQRCHVCNYVNTKVREYAMREWTCPKCGTSHQINTNAAQNVLILGLRGKPM